MTVEQLSAALRSVITSNGFEIAPEKIWFAGPKSRKEVTGLVVNEFTNLKRTFVRDLRAALYKVEAMGGAAAEKDYQTRYKTTASLEKILRGRLEWIAQVRGRSFSAYRTIAKRFNQQFPASAVARSPDVRGDRRARRLGYRFFQRHCLRTGHGVLSRRSRIDHGRPRSSKFARRSVSRNLPA